MEGNSERERTKERTRGREKLRSRAAPHIITFSFIPHQFDVVPFRRNSFPTFVLLECFFRERLYPLFLSLSLVLSASLGHDGLIRENERDREDERVNARRERKAYHALYRDCKI